MSIVYADRVASWLERQKDVVGWLELGRISCEHLEQEHKRNAKYIAWLKQQEDSAKNNTKLYNAELREENNAKLKEAMQLMISELAHLHECLQGAALKFAEMTRELRESKMDLHTFKVLYESEHQANKVMTEMLISKFMPLSADQMKATLANNLDYWESVNETFKKNNKELIL